MNIAILNEFFSPVIKGGTELFLLEFAKYLKKKGHKLIIITSDQGQIDNSEFKVYKIKSSPFHFSHRYQFSGITTKWAYYNTKIQKEIDKIYNNEKIDLVYANNIPHISFAPLQTKRAIILDVHDYWPVCFSRDLYYNKKYCANNSINKCAICLTKRYKIPFLYPYLLLLLPLEKRLTGQILKKSRKIISHSNFVKNELAKEGFISEVISYPYMGTGKKLKAKKNKLFKILFVGRIEYSKGLDIILDVAKQLKGKINFRIDIIGTGSKKIMKELNRPDLNIYLHGFMKEERFEYFSNADCLLVPSKWPEPFGMVVLEAMNFGLPVITLNKGGMAELVKENNAGFALSANEIPKKIIELNKNPQLKKKISDSDKKNIKKYSSEKIFNKYEKLFKDITTGVIL